MKKKVIFFLLVLLTINLVSSQQTQTLGGIDGFPPNTEINLTQICTNCTFVNITYLILGNGQLEKVDSAMTKDGTFYNYSLVEALTTSLGEYTINWVADPDGVSTTGNYNLFIRNNGTLLTTAESFLFIFLALFNLIIVAFFLYHGITLPYSDERSKDGTLTRLISAKYLKLLSFWIGYGSLVWLSSIITGITNNFIPLGITRTLITNLHVFLYVLAYPLSLLILSILLIEVYKDMFVPLFMKIFMGVTKRRKNI